MNATTKRTDIHRPSVIKPEDYEFVGVEYAKASSIDEVYSLAHYKAVIQTHMRETGGTYSRHAHGGNCHVCGAHCIYTVLFYHRPSNTYIRTGFDCAANLEYHDEKLFRSIKADVKSAREAKAGKQKAQATLADAGLERAYGLFELNSDSDSLLKLGVLSKRMWNDGKNYTMESTWEYRTLCDIVEKLVRYGSLSEKQIDFLRTLVDKIDHKAEREAEHEAKIAAERETAADCPNGRVEINGEVLMTKYVESMYGETLKMLVKDNRGFKVWGTVPSALLLFDIEGKQKLANETEAEFCRKNGHEVGCDEHGWFVKSTWQRGLEKGDKVSFVATVTPSDRDAKFGFFKRPSKAKLEN